MRWKKSGIYAPIIFLLSFSISACFYYLASMSMSVTVNGVYKATELNMYIDGSGPLESGGLLYYPALKHAYRLLSIFFDVSTYDTIVLFNGFCGAILSSILFILSYHICANLKRSILISGVHFFIPSVFFLATSNEDIFPAYTFYVFGLLIFILYLKKPSNYKLFVTTVLFSISMLFHWTIGLPTFAALYLFLSFYPDYKWQTRLKVTGSVIMVQAGVFLLASLILGVPYFEVWYPGKAADSLWISGINLSNIPLVLYNSVSFFIYGTKELSLDDFPFGLLQFIPILPFALVLGYAMFKVFIGMRQNRFTVDEKQVFAYLFLVFVFGTGMNYYEQGNDPQFLIQPLLFFLFVLFLFTKLLSEKLGRILIVCTLTLFLHNIAQSVIRNRHRDTRSWANVEMIKERTGDLGKTLLIGGGFEDVYGLVQYEMGSVGKAHFMHFPHGDVSETKMSNEDYLQMAKDSIESYVHNGFEIVLVNFINKSPEQIGQKFNTYDLSEKMAMVQAYLTENYEIERIPETYRYDFFYLEPKFEVSVKQD